jgi:hypothetical protein
LWRLQKQTSFNDTYLQRLQYNDKQKFKDEVEESARNGTSLSYHATKKNSGISGKVQQQKCKEI